MKAIFDLGYFQDVQVKLEPFRDGYRVVFEVKENALIKDIIIEGSSILERAGNKRNHGLKTGAGVSQKILQNDLDRISQLYKDRGLILAQVEKIDFNQNTGVLLLRLAEDLLKK